MKDFDYENPKYTMKNGHFLQLVWPDTKYVGVGISYALEANKAFTVARYDDGPSSQEVNEKEVTIPKEAVEGEKMLVWQYNTVS